MSEPEQLTMLTADDAPPPRWVCPTCRGNKQMLRLLYPDEREEGGPLTVICPCRTCRATGWIAWDPDDHTVIPY